MNGLFRFKRAAFLLPIVTLFGLMSASGNAVAQGVVPIQTGDCQTPSLRPPSTVYGACIGGAGGTAGFLWYRSPDAAEAALRARTFIANASSIAFPLLYPPVSTRGAATVESIALGPARYFQTWSDIRPLGNYADVRSSTASIDGSTTYFRLRLKDWPLAGYPCGLGATELNGGCSTLEAELDRFFRARQASGLCRGSDFVIGNPPTAPWQPTSRRVAIFPITQPDSSLQLGVRRDFLQTATSPTYFLRVQWASCTTVSTAGAGAAKAVPANAEITPIDVVNTALCPSGLSPENGAPDPCSGQIKLALTQPSFTQYDTEFCEGNPCYPGTGNKTVSQSDFEYGAIRFERHYNTLRQLRTFAGMGENWTHGFSARILTSHFITNDHNSGSAASPDGSYVFFQTARATLEPFRKVSSGVFRSDN